MSYSNFIITLIVIFSIPNVGATQVINKDSSLVTFKISNLGINTVEGTIAGFDGDMLFDTDDLSKNFFNVCIDPTTINSGIAARDRELLEEEYFHTANYPQICFKSESIVQTEEGFLATGILTLKETSREVTIAFTAEQNTLTGIIEIDRTDYGVGPRGGFLEGKTVELRIICVLLQ